MRKYIMSEKLSNAKIKKIINNKTINKKNGFNNIKFRLENYNLINEKKLNQIYTRNILKNTYSNNNNLYNNAEENQKKIS